MDPKIEDMLNRPISLKELDELDPIHLQQLQDAVQSERQRISNLWEDVRSAKNRRLSHRWPHNKHR